MAVIERPTTPLVGIDDESLALILELQRQDGEHLGSVAIGKKCEGSPPSDLEAALKLYLEEVAQATVFAFDRRVARSIQTAVREDANTLQHLVAEEHMATQDHHLSLELSRGGSGQSTATPEASADIIKSSEDEDMELIEKMAYLYVTGEHDDTEDIYSVSDDDTSTVDPGPESSAWAASRPQRTRLCVACGDRRHFADVSRAPCRHEYCRDCLRRLFEDAMRDETLFPPRRCQKPLPLSNNILLLPQSVVETFRKKAVEFSTPNRTYCHRKSCFAFVPPGKCANGVARCGDCDAETCTNCKGASHGGDCPHDEQLQQVIAMARQEGWQRCQNCWSMVELRTGCYHMTCRCGAQFCYVCGTAWKHCSCEQWDEHRLYERAAQIDARNNADLLPEGVPAPLKVDAMMRNGRINRLMQNLRENHECDHRRWASRRGPRECEECGDEMPIFIYECRQCNIFACRRCRYNRL